MSILAVFVLAVLGVWLWLVSRKQVDNKGMKQNSADKHLQTMRNDPSYQPYSEKANEIFGESFDRIYNMAQKLHETNKEEDDLFQKRLKEGLPFPFPKQITLLDELDSMITNTHVAWNTLYPPEPRHVFHNEYNLMLDHYKEWSKNYRAFLKLLGTTQEGLNIDSTEALHKHDMNLQQASEKASASLRRALEQQQKVKKLVLEMFVDTLAAVVKDEAEEARDSYILAEPHGFKKEDWPCYHGYARRLLSLAKDTTQFTLARYGREKDKDLMTYLVAMTTFIYLAKQYGIKATGNEATFEKLPDAVLVLFSYRNPTWQEKGIQELRDTFQQVAVAAQKNLPDLAPRDNWENAFDTVLGRFAYGAVQKMGVDLSEKKNLEPLMEIVTYWNKKVDDLADAHNKFVDSLSKQSVNRTENAFGKPELRGT